jgi:S1-C subfamily serine protease
MPGSPAAQSGLKPCDLIEQVGGNDVKNPSQVQLAVDGGRVGAPLTIGIRRQSQKAQVVVRPAELPQQG